MPAYKYLAFLILMLGMACQSDGQEETAKEAITSERDFQQLLAEEFQNVQAYSIREGILMDLTGDGQPEQIKLQPVPDRLNLVITDGASQIAATVLAGPGKGNFDWVDYWGVVQDSTVSKVTVVEDKIVGGTTIKLPYPALVFRQDETGGGMIAFLDGSYQWIHQAD